MGILALNNVYANLKSRGTSPQVDIQSYTKVGDKAFKIVAAVSGVDNEADFSAVVANITDGLGRVIPGSFNSKGRIVVATIAANTKSKPIDASFKMVTANTALAADGGIWSVVDGDGGKRVMMESCDSLAEILATRRASRSIHANPVEGFGLVTAGVSNGDLIRYVDSASATTKWGFAFHTDAGISVANMQGVVKTITQDEVVAAVPRSKLDKETAACVNAFESNAKLSSDKLNGILGYLKKAWAKSPIANQMEEKYRKMAESAK